jgi:SAM-dependent methyltransferase
MPMMPSDLSDPSDRPGAAFQGRGRQYLSLLACPVDGAPLAMGQNEAVCVADSAHRYPIEAGILRLADGGLRAALDEMSRQHEDDAAAEGWQTPDEEAFKRLPQTGLKGYPEFHWTQYAEATAVLWRYLEAIRAERGALPVGPVGEAAVIGADTGWLAYALDVAGYTTIALDAYVGEGYGLGVYPIARYVRVQADPVHPPLARGAFDIVLFQEGLARSREAADEAAALARAIEALRPGGHVVVMDAFPGSIQAVEALQRQLEQAGLRLMDRPPRLTWRARMAERVDQVLGRDGSLPPVTVAQKPG